MKRTGSRIIPFPLSRRTEQNGVTQRRMPGRWLGVLLLASAGGAWALSPTVELESALSEPVIAPQSLVVEGHPQVASQVLGSVVGPEAVPEAELKAMTGRRVVLEQVAVEAPPVRDAAGFQRLAEEVESFATVNGRYPAGLSEAEEAVEGVEYSPSRGGFQLRAQGLSYDSQTGFVDSLVEETPPSFALRGVLGRQVAGWGPWTQESGSLEPVGEQESELGPLRWLETLGPAPDWSARLFFPISKKTTGAFFANPDARSPYANGEFHYDGVKGTFTLKLHREEGVACLALDPQRLEESLSEGVTSLAGDALFLKDLGLANALEVAEDEAVVRLQGEVTLDLGASSEVQRQRLKRLARQKSALVPGLHKASKQSEGVALVGRLRLVDKMGQLHEVRLRGGRGKDYDWVVGQLCPLTEASRWKHATESGGESWERSRFSDVKIVAGQ